MCGAGTQLKLAGRVAEGVTHYREAVAACPAYAPAFYNIGVVHRCAVASARPSAEGARGYSTCVPTPATSWASCACQRHAARDVQDKAEACTFVSPACVRACLLNVAGCQ